MQTPNATSIMGVFGGLLQRGTSRFRHPTWNSWVSASSFPTFTRRNDGFAIKLVVDFFICHLLKSSRHWTLIDSSLLRNHQSL